MQNTLPGLEFTSHTNHAQEEVTIKLVHDFLEGKTPHMFDAAVATELIQCAKSIDSYVMLQKNPSTLFEQYNNALDRLQALHPDPLATVDDDVADFIESAAR